MIRQAAKLLSRFWAPEKGPYALLILLFLTIFVITPLLSAGIVMPVILHTTFWLVILAGAFNVSSRRSVRLLALIVALLSVASRWVGLSLAEDTIREADIIFSLAMLSIFTLLMIKSFLVTGRPWADRIAAAVTVYMMLGLIWARLYEAVGLLFPNAFRLPEGETLNLAVMVYYSFVTLATLGYGDIAPVNIIARNLAVLEAITGQLYLVILISRLVSERLANSGEQHTS
jgi:hypothetical protein